MDIIKKWIRLFRGLMNDGLFHIFGSSVIAQVGGLISSIVVIRNLPKVDYGFYVNANNVYSYLAVFIGLGYTSAVLQYCSEHIDEKIKFAIYRFTGIFGNLANGIIAIVILGLSAFRAYHGDTAVAGYLAMMAGLPFASYLYSYMVIVLRVKGENRMFAYANIAYAISVLIGNILLTSCWGIPGLVISQYIANIMGASVCYWALRKEQFFVSVTSAKNLLNKTQKKEITSYAFICAITNFASAVLILLDITCLDIVIGDSAVLADYKVASTIPTACAFIPTCLVTFFYPRLVKALSSSKHEGKNMVKQLGKVFFFINGVVYLGLAVFARLIIWIIFGEKYLNIVPIFEILCLNFFIQSIKRLLGNTIAAIKHVKVNLIISILSGILNITLNLLLISQFKSVGAAIATTLTAIITLSMEYFYLQKYWKEYPGPA